MIPLQFGLFWSGSKITYLRYLTFLTLRIHHPNAQIDLYISKKGVSEQDKNVKWENESQDFKADLSNKKDYLDQLPKLNVNIIETERFDGYAPNFQSDFFRWWWLGEFGGFYLDTDQLILKPFSGLDLDSHFIYSSYVAKSCGFYCPVGVLGADRHCSVIREVRSMLSSSYKESVYNSIGPDMFKKYLLSLTPTAFSRLGRVINTPSFYFYPVPESYLVSTIYDGTFKLTGEEYALHWFGGHKLSQRFNEAYSEEFAKNSNDTISTTLRGIIEKNIASS